MLSCMNYVNTAQKHALCQNTETVDTALFNVGQYTGAPGCIGK